MGDFLEIVEWVSDTGDSFLIDRLDKGLFCIFIFGMNELFNDL